MKKLSAYILTLIAVLSFSACLDDDSTTGNYANVSDITISGIEDAYTATAYVGEHLQIAPSIETDYSDMEYQWMLLNSQTGSTNADGDTIQPIVIGTEKNLDYEVAVAPDTYQLRFVASSKSNGYTAYALSTLTVQTNFSQGFYVLKETTDGNTELDLLTAKNETAENLITSTQGQSLQGAPAYLYTNYGMYYINPDNDEMESTAALTVTTEQGDIKVYRTTDMAKIFDRTNLLFDPMDSSEKAYGIIQTPMGYSVYVSSAGIRTTSADGAYSSSKSTGKFGMATEDGVCGSTMFTMDVYPSHGGLLLWDEAARSLLAVDYGGNSSPLTYSDLTGSELTTSLVGYTCLHVGYTYMNRSGSPLAILQDASGNRFLYVTRVTRQGIFLSSRTAISASSHLASATAFATNGLTAKYIYCVSGGKLYAVNYTESDLAEVELQPEGIGSGETINYVGNQFWNRGGGDNFNYLVVGTQNGNTYHLYFYETNGGAPVGQPVKTMTGTGTVKTVKYVNPTFTATYWLFGYHIFNINN